MRMLLRWEQQFYRDAHDFSKRDGAAQPISRRASGLSLASTEMGVGMVHASCHIVRLPEVPAKVKEQEVADVSILDAAIQPVTRARESPIRREGLSSGHQIDLQIELKLFPIRCTLKSTMLRLMLQSLLALTLILNGISAPWAMARMAHAGHGSTAQHTHHPAESDAAVAVTGSDHHGHGDHSGDAPQMPSSPDGDFCCDGVSCQCGCVLPPAVSVALDVVPAIPAGPSSHAALPALLVPHHDSPPLRPPAA
jgi:hypothetical protein